MFTLDLRTNKNRTPHRTVMYTNTNDIEKTNIPNLNKCNAPIVILEFVLTDFFLAIFRAKQQFFDHFESHPVQITARDGQSATILVYTQK